MNQTPNFSALKNIKSAEQKKEEARKITISEDINEINQALQSRNLDKMLSVHRYLDGKYQICVAGWGQSMYGFTPGYGFCEDVLGDDSLIHNLQMMKAKLEAFTEGWNAAQTTDTATIPEINVNTTTTVNVNITFEQVRSQIENMTSLTNEQTTEALEKISEIEAVVNGSGSKKSKWEKIKPVLTWLADKSFDVAMTIIPLLLNLQ